MPVQEHGVHVFGTTVVAVVSFVGGVATFWDSVVFLLHCLPFVHSYSSLAMISIISSTPNESA